jgi:hypothetical protein
MKVLLAIGFQILVGISQAVLDEHLRVCSLQFVAAGSLCQIYNDEWAYFSPWHPFMLLTRQYLGFTYIDAYYVVGLYQAFFVGLPFWGQLMALTNVYILAGSMWKHREDFDAFRVGLLPLLNSFPWSPYFLLLIAIMHLNSQHMQGQLLTRVDSYLFASLGGAAADTGDSDIDSGTPSLLAASTPQFYISRPDSSMTTATATTDLSLTAGLAVDPIHANRSL